MKLFLLLGVCTMNSFVLKPASSIEDIFVLDKIITEPESNTSSLHNVEEDHKAVVEPSAQTSVFQFTDCEQECRTADVYAQPQFTVWTREALWPI